MTTEPQTATTNTETRGERTILTGKVTSAKMQKTIVVEVTRLVQHPKYHRVVRISKKFYAPIVVEGTEGQAVPGMFLSLRFKKFSVNSAVRL